MKKEVFGGAFLNAFFTEPKQIKLILSKETNLLMSQSPEEPQKSSSVEEEESESSGFGDDDDYEDEKSILTLILSYFKLSFIVSAYGIAFVSMIHFGLWLADTSAISKPEFQDKYKENHVLDWISFTIKTNCWNSDIQKVLVDLGLLLLFVLQHSVLSTKIVGDLTLWRSLRYDYKIDKTIYTLLTGIVLQVMIRNWQHIPVKVWDVKYFRENSYYYITVHALAWLHFYGSSLMLDLPDMVGFNQVVIQSPTRIVKSPQLQLMCHKQRHMGLVPFSMMLLAYPYMSLDRLILTIFIMTYLSIRWSSDSCYKYVKDMKQVKRQRLSDSFTRIKS